MSEHPDKSLFSRRAIAFATYRASKQSIAARKTDAAERIAWLGEMLELLREFVPPRDGSDPRVTFDEWGSPHSDAFPSPDDGT